MKAHSEIAIDGLPASPAMAQALAQIAANGAAERAHKAMINADQRIIARRAALKALPTNDCSPGIFLEIIDGTMQRRAILNRLIKARIELLSGFPNHARKIIRDVAAIRKQAAPKVTVVTAETRQAA